MTTMTKTPTPTMTSAVPQRSGFQAIPTRIRDVRDPQVPPLVVEPMAEQNKAAICQSLGELGSRLAEIHRTAAEAYLSQGLYEKSLPHLEAEKLSTLEHYLESEEARRRAWQARLSSPVWDARPNAGHEALVALDRAGRLHTLVTQNIDGLHVAAGHDTTVVIEVHGNARRVRCWDCDAESSMEEALERVRLGEHDPPCRDCGGILKSTTVLFGESLPEGAMERAVEAAVEADLLLAVGTMLSVYPVASMVHVAERAGTPVVVLNGQPT